VGVFCNFSKLGCGAATWLVRLPTARKDLIYSTEDNGEILLTLERLQRIQFMSKKMKERKLTIEKVFLLFLEFNFACHKSCIPH
jgi:hypothetical protein